MATITRHLPEGKQDEQRKLSQVIPFKEGFLFPGGSIHAVHTGTEQIWLKVNPVKNTTNETKPEAPTTKATIVTLDGKGVHQKESERAVTPYFIYFKINDLGNLPVKLSSLEPGSGFKATSKLDMIGKSTADTVWMVVEKTPQTTGKIRVLSLDDAAILTEIDDDYLVKEQKVQVGIEDAKLVAIAQ